jgi:hypothetical protein
MLRGLVSPSHHLHGSDAAAPELIVSDLHHDWLVSSLSNLSQYAKSIPCSLSAQVVQPLFVSGGLRYHNHYIGCAGQAGGDSCLELQLACFGYCVHKVVKRPVDGTIEYGYTQPDSLRIAAERQVFCTLTVCLSGKSTFLGISPYHVQPSPLITARLQSMGYTTEDTTNTHQCSSSLHESHISLAQILFWYHRYNSGSSYDPTQSVYTARVSGTKHGRIPWHHHLHVCLL